METQGTDKNKKFLEYMALTEKERTSLGITSVKSFCDKLGVSLMTYYKWKKRWDRAHKPTEEPEFDLQSAMRKDLPDIYKALKKIITGDKANTRAIEISLKTLGELVEKREDTIKVDYSPAERIKVAREVVKGLRDQYIKNGGNCPLCGRCEILYDEPCLPPERELDESGEVEALGLSA